jgi:hypothetical protein
MFKPKDDLSKQLMRSIPKKMAALFDRMNLKQNVDYSSEFISWFVSPKNGWVTFNLPDSGDELFKIEWTGNYLKPRNIQGSDKRFEHLADNLEFLVAVERSIYNNLEKLIPKIENSALKIANKLISQRETRNEG